jgi:hypothetical protein
MFSELSNMHLDRNFRPDLVLRCIFLSFALHFRFHNLLCFLFLHVSEEINCMRGVWMQQGNVLSLLSGRADGLVDGATTVEHVKL